MDKKRVIFPQDKDLLEEEIVDELKDRIFVALKKDLDDGEKKLILKFGSTHHVTFKLKDKMISSVVQCKDICGRPISYIQYVRNVRHGLYMKFHNDGTVAITGSYKDGLPYGIWKHYDEDGNVENTFNYDIW